MHLYYILVQVLLTQILLNVIIVVFLFVSETSFFNNRTVEEISNNPMEPTYESTQANVWEQAWKASTTTLTPSMDSQFAMFQVRNN